MYGVARLLICAFASFSILVAAAPVSEVEASFNGQINANNQILSELRRKLRITSDQASQSQLGLEINRLTKENDRLTELRDLSVARARAEDRARTDEVQLQQYLDQLQRSNPIRYQATMQILNLPNYEELSVLTRQRLIDEKERQLRHAQNEISLNEVATRDAVNQERQSSYSPQILRVRSALSPIQDLISAFERDHVALETYPTDELNFLYKGASDYTRKTKMPAASGLVAESYEHLLLKLKMEIQLIEDTVPTDGHINLAQLMSLRNLLNAHGYSIDYIFEIEGLALIAENYLRYVMKMDGTTRLISLLQARAAQRAGIISSDSVLAVAEFKRRQLGRNPEYAFEILKVLNLPEMAQPQVSRHRKKALRLLTPEECELIVSEISG